MTWPSAPGRLRRPRYNEPWLRHFMGRVFNLVVRLLVMGQHRDTQCGFKAFSQRAAQDIFHSVRLYGPSSPCSTPLPHRV